MIEEYNLKVDFPISKSLNEDSMMEVVKFFDRYCRENNLKMTLEYTIEEKVVA